MFEALEEKEMVQFLGKFSDHPFLVKFVEHEYPIGEGEPAFRVIF